MKRFKCLAICTNALIFFALFSMCAGLSDITPNDPLFSSQWGLRKIMAPEAWSIERGRRSVIVAIVDTGVDYSHPDLRSNMWTALDGTYGWDFVDNDKDPMDTDGHGTMVAGVVAAVSNNGIGIAGVAWNVSIMAVRVRADMKGPTYYAKVAQGIRYAADRGAKVINLSLLHGSGSYESMRQAISYAYDKGILLVESAGNQNADLVKEPNILHKNVMYVAGTDQNDVKALGSSFGARVDVCAPYYAMTTALGAEYVMNGGTSMSAPYVSGLAALLFSENSTLTNDEVRQIIKTTADDIDSVNPNHVGKLGSGRINAYRALARQRSITATTILRTTTASLTSVTIPRTTSLQLQTSSVSESSERIVSQPVNWIFLVLSIIVLVPTIVAACAWASRKKRTHAGHVFS